MYVMSESVIIYGRIIVLRRHSDKPGIELSHMPYDEPGPKDGMCYPLFIVCPSVRK
jgi:hypothetical protein